jgi:nucleolar complex protein 3
MRENKRRKVSRGLSTTAIPTGDSWDAEQDYERRPRKVRADKATDRLPVKTADGWQFPEEDKRGAESDKDSVVVSSDGEDDETGADTANQPSGRQEVAEAKEELAQLAGLINEDPEEHVNHLKALSRLSQSPNHTVRQLALATQCSVYRDIIPGYRIRPLSEEEIDEKVSKDVKKLRSYEQNLVKAYHDYVIELDKSSRPGNHPSAASLASVAISCASTLVLSVPHFNFRTELLKIVINPLGRNENAPDYDKCIGTVERLFREDDDGRPSQEAVSLLTKMIKARDYDVPESLLNVFLSLSILSGFSSKGSGDKIDKEERPMRGMKKLPQKKQFRTKGERKRAKELKVIQKEMNEADATVRYEERDKIQGDILKLVFATYFRILKAQVHHLMGPVLEGLSRYAHLINQDFFGDILIALKELINRDDEELEEEADSTRDHTRELLLSIATAFALQQGQDGKAALTNLQLDLSSFTHHLYRALIPASLDADIELGPSSLRLPAGDSPSPNVNVKTKTVLLLRSLSAALLPRHAPRSVPPQRLAAFAKQLLTTSLQVPDKSATAVLGLLCRATKLHGARMSALFHTEERRGDGVFDPMRGDAEGSNPFAATVWEGELLRLHYSPKVREALVTMYKNVRADR